MYRVFYCLTVEHDLRLVAVAALLCTMAAIAAVATVRRAASASGERQKLWLLMAGFVTGVGIWGTHFVSMLAYESPVPIHYDLVGTIGSLLLVVFVTSCGWAYVVRGDRAYAPPLGGAVVGAGIATMHFMGIDAMDVGASMHWDTGLVIAAIVLGMQFAAFSAWLVTRLQSRRGLFAGAMTLVAGVVCLHFIAMGALYLTPVAPEVVEQAGASSKLLAVTVALAVILVLGFVITAVGLDFHLGARREAEIRRMRTLADATFEGIAVVRDGIMEDMNTRFCELLQLSRDDLVGMPINKVLMDVSALEAELEGDTSRPVTCRLRGRDGSALTVQVRCRRTELDDQPVDVLAFRDVSSEAGPGPHDAPGAS